MTGILWAVIQQPIKIDRRFSNGQPHHITLQYGVERELWEWMVGQEFEAVIWAEAWNDRIQALRVQIPLGAAGYPFVQQYPHITVSWAEGVEPVESNTMLATNHNCQRISPNLYVACRIEFHEWTEEVSRG